MTPEEEGLIRLRESESTALRLSIQFPRRVFRVYGVTGKPHLFLLRQDNERIKKIEDFNDLTQLSAWLNGEKVES